MGILTVDGDDVRWIGVVLNALGGALRIYPVFVLGRRFSGLVAIQPGHTLVTDDIYGVLRHPSYLGLILNALGWVLVFRSGVGEVHPDEQFAARYPQELGARITFRIKDQRVFVKEQHGYEGGLANPGAAVDKFQWLSEAFADEDLRSRLIRAVQELDTTPLSDLMDRLAQVRPTAVFATSHPGIRRCSRVIASSERSASRGSRRTGQ